MDERLNKPEFSGTRDGRSPWLELWLHPRQVTRWFLDSDDPLKNALLLIVLSGAVGGFSTASGANWGDELSMPGLIIRAVIVGALGGLLSYYLGAHLLKWVGGWFGGEGTADDMRVVIGQISARANLMIGALLIPKLLIARSELFTLETPNLDASPLFGFIFWAITAIEFAWGLWLFIVSLHSIGEAHRFSAWHAFGVEFVLGLFLVIAVIIVVAIILSASGPPIWWLYENR
ncbi:YIP1 family protein [Saccharibacillus sacchari]|uniref:YIP1 family protein n=1 Tax=Saccharibacillus sacchari TaxID=456493 RepID=A0ACC6P6F3_9BACL